MRIKYDDIREGDAYEHYGYDQARLIYLINEDGVHYYAFDLISGHYKWRNRCSLLSFYQWQNGKINSFEYNRLDISTAERTLLEDIKQIIEFRGIDPSEIKFLAKLEEKLKGDQ